MDVIITRHEWTWLLHVTNGHDYNTSRMDMIITGDEWMWLQHVTNGCDYYTWRMDVIINTWRMDVIITRHDMLLHVANGHDYNTDEWTWL